MRFIPQYEPVIQEEYISKVVEQLKSGWIGSSQTTIDFENKIAEVSKVKHCISTTSGTVALMIAIQSLNLPKNSTIIFPSYTFLAGANAARFLGYHIELIDISEETLCLDPKKIIFDDDSISCIMYVNHNGYMGGNDLEEIRDICEKRKIYLIEDCCQAFGMIGTIDNLKGDVGAFSFSVPKLITTGQGGVVITENDEIAEKCKRIRDHGDNWRKSKIHNHLGINLKFNDILASYGLAQIEVLNQLKQKRKNIFDIYRKYLTLIDFGYESSWMVLYRTKNAEKIIKKLRENQIQATQYYRPINWNPPYQSQKKKFPVAEKIYNEIIYLPSSLNLIDEEIENICSIVLEVENV